MESLPGNISPSQANYKYGTTLYKVRLCRNVKHFYKKIWYWDLKSNSWIRTFCSPATKEMTRI